MIRQFTASEFIFILTSARWTLLLTLLALLLVKPLRQRMLRPRPAPAAAAPTLPMGVIAGEASR